MIVGNGITPMSTSGGRFLYNIELPPSQFYGHASEWISTSQLGATPAVSAQIVCNGALWVLTQSNFYCRDLITKEILEIVPISLPGTLVLNSQWNCSLTTDGLSRIWFSTSTGGVAYLNEFNVLTKNFVYYTLFSCPYSYLQSCYVGYVIYSSYYNRVYTMCGYQSSESSTISSNSSLNTTYPAVQYLDLSTNVVYSAGVSFNNWDTCGYTYEDPKTGFIYFGYGYGGTSKNVYMFNPETNTFTLIASGIGIAGSPNIAHYNIGDSIVAVSQTQAWKFDPKTGLISEDQIPGVPGIVMYSTLKGSHNGTLYYALDSANTTMMECSFFTEPPPDAPIVARIYKGQKFHSLKPISLPRLGIEVTSKQQVAEEDLTIYMYDYSNTGFQYLYIENMD